MKSTSIDDGHIKASCKHESFTINNANEGHIEMINQCSSIGSIMGTLKPQEVDNQQSQGFLR